MRSVFIALCWAQLFGISLPAFAVTHPSGPDDRPFDERTIQIRGVTHAAQFDFAYPRAEDGGDDTVDNTFKVLQANRHVIGLTYPYRGFFWQGLYGEVHFDLSIVATKKLSESFDDLDSILQTVRAEGDARNERTRSVSPDERQVWSDPFISQLNGIPCVQQNEAWGRDAKKRQYYYFPFERFNALLIRVDIVDNSNTPGKPPSDWRARADALADKLLSTVKIRVDKLDAK